MKTFLKQAIVDKFDAIKLDDAQFAVLEMKLKTSPNQRGHANSHRHNQLQWQAIAASVIFCLMAAFGNHIYRGYQTDALVAAIATEATYNHLKLKPLEIETEDQTEVFKYFNKLDFKPIKLAEMTKKPGDRLLGGRYCSIQGLDAAQLRVISKDGTLNTWYQGILPQSKLKLLPDVSKGELPAIKSMKGLQARIWHEQGIVFIEVKN